ncbi:hypothetical protein FSP39_005589 [Pinctada imbricata]|uniref:Tr-type G domain-containing protein n=1 Tax=Pinctada imbricata TaxID=66713 RepID=A0AA88XVL0_PINIB|nr:hypothetical protein FSP39_005589 [Pinctada imbricata]
MDTNEHSAIPLPVYEYKLQWWLFVPNRPLKMISEITLFGEDINEHLFLSFCEWPDDTSKALIFGSSVPDRNQDSCCQCYITITSIPPLNACTYCNDLRIFTDGRITERPMCLKHGFTVHTKYELTPPFPPFSPRVQLKISGVAIMNTGDSIVALLVTSDGCGAKCDVDVNDESQKENVDNGSLKEYPRQRSPRAVLVDPRTSLSDQNAKHNSNKHLVNSPQQVFERYEEEANSSELLSGGSSSVMQEVHMGGSQIHPIDKDGDKIHMEHMKCLKSPKVDTVDSAKCASPKSDMVSLSQNLKSSPPHVDHREIQIDTSCPSPSPACKSPGRARSPILPCPVNSPLQVSSLCNSQVGGSRNHSQRSFFSPSNSSTTSTSKSADSLYLQVKESRTVTFTVRRFCQQMGNESPGIVEEDFDLAYRSILPLEVYGDKYTPLAPAHCKEATQCIKVTQLTFDVEHYIEEVIGHLAEWGHRYVAFTNYDLQIIDVCPDSNSVIGKVHILIHAKEDQDGAVIKKPKRNKPAIKLYQTSLSFTWNLTTGEVHHGNTVMDYMDLERDRGITITSAAITYHWNKHKVNLIDTPGHVDFTIEVERALRVLDGAVVILDSSAGVEAQTLTVWKQANRYHIPTLIYLNKLDKLGSSVKKSLNSIEEKLKIEPYLITFPYGDDIRNFPGVVDIVDMKKHMWDLKKTPDGRKFSSEPISEQEDGEIWNSAVNYRTALIGELSDIDEQLADEVLMETPIEQIPANLVRKALRKATINRKLAPVYCGSSLKNKGIQLLLDGINSYLPSPQERELDFVKYYGSNLCAFAFKTIHDKQKKPLTFFRIYSGSLKSGASIYNLNKECTEKVSSLVTISADEFHRVSEATAGNIVGVTGLSKTITGDTITSSASSAQSAATAMHIAHARSPEESATVTHTAHAQSLEEDGSPELKQALLAGLHVPSPVFFCSVEPPSMAYQKDLDIALQCLQREDPTLKVEENKDTGQTILWGMGELHLEVIKSRILKEYKVDVHMGPLQIAYRESIQQEIEVNHTLQSEIGKYIQIGYRESIQQEIEVDLTLQSEIGSKDQYVNMTLVLSPVSGRPKFTHLVLQHDREAEYMHSSYYQRFHLPAVEKGVRQALSYGPLLSFPVINVDVKLLHLEVGRHTSVPFVSACASDCVNKAFEQVNPILLEPMMNLEIHVVEDRASGIIKDLSGRRSQILNIEPQDGECLIQAVAPLAELRGYSTQIRILSSGNCTFNMEFSHYEGMSEMEQNKAIEAVTGFSPI